MGEWVEEHWFDALQTAAIVSGFLFTVWSLRSTHLKDKVTNYLNLVQYHRDLWSLVLEYPELASVIGYKPRNFIEEPITEIERRFAIFRILHISMSYHLFKVGALPKAPKLKQEIASSFRNGVMRQVWSEVRELQEPGFMRFIESCIDIERARPSTD